ncbi:MAG: antibiotic biosynthesis monooxygenase [Pseudomonadota bacterium]
MFVAMNRFKVKDGSEAAFEEMWRSRESHLDGMKGFVEFKLLRGPNDSDEGFTLYASHTTWASKQDFIDWTKSEQFRKAHAGAGKSKVQYMGHPQLEAFDAVEGTVIQSDAA